MIKKLLLLLTLLCLPVIAEASSIVVCTGGVCTEVGTGGGGGSTLIIQDEGSTVAGTTLNFVGTGIVCVPSAGVITCTVTTGGGSGTVTSVGLVGTANQITVTGATPITGAGSWTLSFPTNMTLPGTTTGTFSGNLTGNVTGTSGSTTGNAATATALAENGANCTSPQFPLGVTAAGAAENCTALPTTIVGTANQITVSSPTGTVTLSIPTNPTLPGTTTGTFTGNLTGNVTGNTSGTASSITGLLTLANFPNRNITGNNECGVDSGSTHDYVANLTPAITSYQSSPPILYCFKANTANSTAANKPTVALNGLTPLVIRKTSGGVTTPLVTNDIRPGMIVMFFYDGTNAQCVNCLGNAPTVTAPGSDGEVIINTAGAFATDPAGLLYNPTTNVLTAAGGLGGGNCTTDCAIIDTSAYAGHGQTTVILPWSSTPTLQVNGAFNINTETTGNTLTLYDEIWSDAAGCNNTTAGPVWNLNTANVPTFTCEGTNTRKGIASFNDTTDQAFDGSFILPTGFVTGIDIMFKWKAAAITGATGWCFQMVRVPDAATSDPALPAQATGNCVSDTTKATTLQENDTVITNATCTSCVAGDHIYWRLSRDANGGAVTDSMTGDAMLMAFGRRVRKAQ